MCRASPTPRPPRQDAAEAADAERGAKRQLAARVAELDAALDAARGGRAAAPDAELLAAHAAQLAQARRRPAADAGPGGLAPCLAALHASGRARQWLGRCAALQGRKAAPGAATCWPWRACVAARIIVEPAGGPW